jgi:hypothetical protein
MSEEIRLSLSDSLRVSISDDDLIAKMSDTENNFIERKLVKDHRGWLKTAVAFANSCPISFPGVLFVGVDNKGNVEQHDKPIHFEDLQKSTTIAGDRSTVELCADLASLLGMKSEDKLVTLCGHKAVAPPWQDFFLDKRVMP